ncbi:MAG TPA: GGDEF domain-containing protein [Burkholderiales bacterium]
MAPDLRTVLAMLAASALLMSVVLCVGIRTRRADGFLKWNAGLGVLAAGWLLSMLRGWLPDVAAVAGAEALLLSGFCLQLAAVAEFGQQRARPWLWVVPGPLLFLALLLFLRNPAALTAAASVACAAALAATATATRRLAGGGAPRRMLGLACDAGAVILLARAASSVFLSRARPEFLPAVETAALIGLFMTSAAASIGFLLLHRERAEAGLARLAAYDPLTEAFNRLAFMNLAEGQVARARRSGEPCSLLMLDLDHFKRVNGRFRRSVGDRALRELAAILRSGLRSSDLVGRYSGEEFCVLLPNTTLGVALEVAERLRATVAARRLGAVTPAVTVSVGVAPCEAERAGALHVAIASAEQALRVAKKDGCNRVARPPLPRRARRAA